MNLFFWKDSRWIIHSPKIKSFPSLSPDGERMGDEDSHATSTLIKMMCDVVSFFYHFWKVLIFANTFFAWEGRCLRERQKSSNGYQGEMKLFSEKFNTVSEHFIENWIDEGRRWFEVGQHPVIFCKSNKSLTVPKITITRSKITLNKKKTWDVLKYVFGVFVQGKIKPSNPAWSIAQVLSIKMCSTHKNPTKAQGWKNYPVIVFARFSIYLFSKMTFLWTVYVITRAIN